MKQARRPARLFLASVLRTGTTHRCTLWTYSSSVELKYRNCTVLPLAPAYSTHIRNYSKSKDEQTQTLISAQERDHDVQKQKDQGTTREQVLILLSSAETEKKQLEQERDKYRQLYVDVLIKLATAKDDLKKIRRLLEERDDKIEALEKEIKDLKQEIKDLKPDIIEMKQDIIEMKKEKVNTKFLVDVADLISLYHIYITEPVLSKQWCDFSPVMVEQLDKLEDKEITQEEFSTWIDKYNKIVGIDLVALFELSQRNNQLHTQIRSANQQKVFLQSFKQNWINDSLPSAGLGYEKVVKEMYSTLEKTTLSRLLPKEMMCLSSIG